MKIQYECLMCHGSAGGVPEIILVPVTDERLLRVTCAGGHEAIVWLHQQRFEYLYESGAFALLDGYAREAVASFAASVERFHEYAIRVLMLRSGIDSQQLEPTWKRVSSQSERQYGAFLFLFHAVTGEPVPKELEKSVSFRNDVIHKGHMATESEALAYGETCLSYIRDLGRRLQLACSTEIDLIDMPENAAEPREPSDKAAYVTYWNGTLLNLSEIYRPSGDPELSLEAWLVERRTNRQAIRVTTAQIVC